jgi:hypothetical protein
MGFLSKFKIPDSKIKSIAFAPPLHCSQAAGLSGAKDRHV